MTRESQLPAALPRIRHRVVLAGLVTAAFLTALLAAPDGALPYVSDLGILASAILAALLCAKRARGDDEARAWWLIAGACGTWTCGQAAWTWQQLVMHTVLPFPSAADVGFLAALPLAAVGGPMLVEHLRDGSRTRLWLDGWTVAAATFLGMWALVGTAVTGSGVARENTLAVAYPVAYAAVGSLLLFHATAVDRNARPDVVLIGAGMAAIGAVALPYAVMLVNGAYQTGDPIDAAWFLGFALIAVAAVTPARDGPVPQDREARSRLVLPYLAIIAAAAVLVTRCVRGDLRDPVLVGASFVVIGFVLLRQFVALRENEALRHELAARVQARTRALAESEERLRLALTAGGFGTFDADAVHGLVRWSPEVEDIFGYAPGTFEQSIDAVLAIVHPDDVEHVRDAITTAFDRGSNSAEFRIVRPDGTVRWVAGSAGSFETHRPRLVGVLGDVTDRREVQDHLAYLAAHDPLTGVGNRLTLTRRIDDALATQRPVALLVLDLNGFKEINDSLGHPMGDRVLQEVAARLQQTSRAGDTIARLGGDEFAVLLPNTDVETALVVAARHAEALADPITVADGLRLPAPASIGVAGATGADDGETLLKHADVAMYAAKSRKQRVLQYTDELEAPRLERLGLLADLRGAIIAGDVVAVFQPKLHLRSGQVVGFEALARWSHPRVGAIPPMTFVPLAEDAGLIGELTASITEQALRAQAAWRSRGADVSIAVNISPHLLRDPTFADALVERVTRHGAPTGSVTLEITENALARGELIIRALERFRELGFGISVDDFGTGYSGLSYFARLPISELKIDSSLVRDVAAGGTNSEIVRVVVELCHRLGIDVVAEGVEDAATLQVLDALGCDFVQGFHIGAPMAADAVDAWQGGSLPLM